MSYFTTDILIVFEKKEPDFIVETLHGILEKFDFNIDVSQASHFHLSELENDAHLEKDYDRGREVKNPIDDLEKLKSHPGGAITYEYLNNEGLLVGFTSMDDITINGILFYTKPYFAEQYKDLFDNIIKDIKKRVTVLGIMKGDDIFDRLDEEKEIENILTGKMNGKYEYIVD